MAGRGGEVPVHAGWADPLCAEWVGVEYVHGQDGMGDSGFPQALHRAEPENAVDELVRRVGESPGELTILAQAPRTNIAAAVMRDPTIAGKVEQRIPTR
jgi:purine nucleosidase